VSPGLRELVITLHDTGARPGELFAATAADWDEDTQAIVYASDERRQQGAFRHKTAGKDKDRSIYFSGQSLAVVRELLERHPTGPLFRNRNGLPWTGHAIDQAFRRLRRRTGLPNLIAYSFRHGFATAWLKAGKSVDVLAELLGNSPETIRKYYSHLTSDRMAIRRQLDDFLGGK
jgi:integrase